MKIAKQVRRGHKYAVFNLSRYKGPVLPAVDIYESNWGYNRAPPGLIQNKAVDKLTVIL